MTFLQDKTDLIRVLRQELATTDARSLLTNIAFKHRLATAPDVASFSSWDEMQADEDLWPESIQADAASDARWSIEERALATGDPKLIEIVTKRRRRDHDLMPAAA